jgi:hypothetical protein
MDGTFCPRRPPFSPLITWDGQCMPRLLKALSVALSRERKRTTFLLSCGEDVAIRISSCALPGASDWLNDVQSALRMSDQEFQVAVRLRLGVPLSVLVPPSGSCPLCRTDMRDHQDHPFASCAEELSTCATTTAKADSLGQISVSPVSHRSRRRIPRYWTWTLCLRQVGFSEHLGDGPSRAVYPQSSGSPSDFGRTAG